MAKTMRGRRSWQVAARYPCTKIRDCATVRKPMEERFPSVPTGRDSGSRRSVGKGENRRRARAFLPPSLGRPGQYPAAVAEHPCQGVRGAPEARSLRPHPSPGGCRKLPIHGLFRIGGIPCVAFDPWGPVESRQSSTRLPQAIPQPSHPLPAPFFPRPACPPTAPIPPHHPDRKERSEPCPPSS